MNRRSFIKRFVVAAAGLSLGASLLTDRITAIPVAASKGLRVNPAWIDAPYEAIICGLTKSTKDIWVQRTRDEYLKLAGAQRFEFVDGQYREVQQFTEG